MAVTSQGGTVVGASAASATQTITIPTGASVGSLAVVWASSQSAAVTYSADRSFGAATITQNGTSIGIAVMTKVLIAGDPGATLTVTSSGASKRLTVGIIVLSGAGTVDVSAGGSGSALATVAPTATPTVADDFVLTLHAMQSAAARSWSGWTLGGTASSNGPNGGSGSGGAGGVESAAFYVNDYAPTTATGTLTATATGSITQYVTLTITVKNAGGTGGTYPVKVNLGAGWVVKPVKVNLGAGWVTKVARNQSGVNPITGSGLYGSSYYNNSVSGFQTMDATLATAAGLTGQVMVIRRCYNTTIPADFAHSQGASNPGSNLHSVLSIKSEVSDPGGMAAGRQDAAVIALVQSCPSAYKTYMPWHHEPEDLVPANFRDGFARFAKLVVANRGSLPVYPVICMQQYTWNPASGRQWSDWDPAPALAANSVASGHPTLGPLALSEVVFAPDGYSHDNTGKLPADLFDVVFAAATTSGFTRFGLSEVACESDGTFGASASTWTTALVAYAAAKAMEYVAWYAAFGPNAPTNGWFMFNTAQEATWANAARNFGP